MRPEQPVEVIKIVAANLTQLRSQQRLSLSELAERSGVAKATLSELEAGRGNPTLETLWNLSAGLQVSFSDLVSAPPVEDVRVARIADIPTLGAPGEHARLLDRLHLQAVVEVFHLVAAPGTDRLSPPHGPKVTEALLVVKGQLLSGPEDQARLLTQGDLIYFPADQPHRYVNPGAEEAHSVVWIAYPRS